MIRIQRRSLIAFDYARCTMFFLDQQVLFLLVALVVPLLFLERVRAALRALRTKISFKTSQGRCPFASRGGELVRTIDELEVRVKKYEDDGDVRGAMELLLAHHDANLTRSHAVKLAHGLSQRYPDILGSDGCPVRGVGSMVASSSGDKSSASVTPPAQPGEIHPEPAGKDDGDSGEPFQTMGASGLDESRKQDESPWERGWKGPGHFRPPSQESSTHVPRADGEASSRRNFTVAQLNTFDGSYPVESTRQVTKEGSSPRPIYIAVRGTVYDASAGRDLYGPGGRYSEFAGHDISRHVASGLAKPVAGGSKLDVADGGNTELDDLSLEGLGRFEVMTLAGWEDTFAARGYPVVGRVVKPPPPRRMSRTELRVFNGGEDTPLSPGYATPSILVGVKDRVFDVSFGGSQFYRAGGEYECLAGRDASRVLAKMSMDPEDIEGLLDYSSATEREMKNLDDWVRRLDQGKGYPTVGLIDL